MFNAFVNPQVNRKICLAQCLLDQQLHTVSLISLERAKKNRKKSKEEDEKEEGWEMVCVCGGGGGRERGGGRDGGGGGGVDRGEIEMF